MHDVIPLCLSTLICLWLTVFYSPKAAIYRIFVCAYAIKIKWNKKSLSLQKRWSRCLGHSEIISEKLTQWVLKPDAKHSFKQQRKSAEITKIISSPQQKENNKLSNMKVLKARLIVSLPKSKFSKANKNY